METKGITGMKGTSGASPALRALLVALVLVAAAALTGYILYVVEPAASGVVKAMSELKPPSAGDSNGIGMMGMPKAGDDKAPSFWAYAFYGFKWLFYSAALVALVPALAYSLGRGIGFAVPLAFRSAGYAKPRAGAAAAAAIAVVGAVVAALAKPWIAGELAKGWEVALAVTAFAGIATAVVGARSTYVAVAEERARSYVVNSRLAFRNLSRHKKATFLLGGVIGFGILIVSLMQGWTGSLVSNVSANFANLVGGHIFVTGTERLPSGAEYTIIRDDSALLEALSASGIETKSVSKLAEFQATLVFEGNSTMQGILGADFTKDKFITERLVPSSGGFDRMSERTGIIISETMAKAMKANAGDRILAQLRTYSGQQNVGEFLVAAIVKDAGLFSLASYAYANLDYVNELLNLPQGSYQMISFFLPDMKRLDADGDAYYAALKQRAQVFDRKNAEDERADMMAKLRGEKTETWEGVKYKVKTLNDQLSGLKDLVAGINIATLIVLAVLFMVIMVGISNTFRMIMLDRIKEIGTMRALGMQKGDVLSLFLDEALFLSLGGVVAGFGLAAIATKCLELIDFGSKTFLSLILRNGHLSFSLSPLIVLANVFIIGALTLVAARLPARAAADLEPAHALRTSK